MKKSDELTRFVALFLIREVSHFFVIIRRCFVYQKHLYSDGHF